MLHSRQLFDIAQDTIIRVHPETSNFVCVQGALKTKKRSVRALCTWTFCLACCQRLAVVQK